MISNRFSTLLIATLMVSSVGCSSNRFRNLLSRSDYETLEELESRDSDSQSSLVSQERLIEDEDAEEAERKSPTQRALFVLGSFLRGPDSDEEITSDPFVESVGYEEFDVAEEAYVDNRVDPIQEDTARAFVEEAARSEETAESLIREAAENSDLDPFDRNFVEQMTASAEDSPHPLAPEASNNGINQQSFVDFLAGTSADTNDTNDFSTSDQTQEFGKEFAALAEASANTEMSEFDNLLGKATSSSSDELSPSELFPELDELLHEQAEETVVSKPEEKVVSQPEQNVASTPEPSSFSPLDHPLGPAPVLSIEPRTEPGPESYNTPMTTTTATAAAQPRSPEDAASDPWSAFRKKAPAPKAQPADKAFSWANSRPAPIEEAPAFETALFDEEPQQAITQTSAAFDAEPPAPEFTSSESPLPEFTSADLTSQDFTSPVFDESEAGGLIIPTSPTLELTENDIPETLEENPFAEAHSIAAEEADAETESPVETTAGFPFSSRTLFLLIGCIIIGFLLFMPDRKNRTNA